MSGRPMDGADAPLTEEGVRIGGIINGPTKAAAAKGAGETPEFYIDLAAFDRLAEKSEQAAAELERIAGQFRMARSRPSVKHIQATCEIKHISEMIDNLLSKGSCYAAVTKESKAALDAVAAYFRETAADIKRVEKGIISLMEAWEQG